MLPERLNARILGQSSQAVIQGRLIPGKCLEGGLPYSANETDLENLFASQGTVSSVTVITDW